MGIIYTFFIRIYYLLVYLASFHQEKAKQWIEGRKQSFSILKKNINPSDNNIWVHCASLGEFEQGRPIIEEIKKKFPDYKIILSFFSPSGYEIRKNYELADAVVYLPIDTSENAKEFIRLSNPRLAIFVKYEFWKNYFSSLSEKKIPLYIVSANFRETHIFFKSWGGFFKKILRDVTFFFVQKNASKDLLNRHEFENVMVAGDTRFDRVTTIASQRKELPLVKKFSSGSFVLVAGSTWPEDENHLLGALQRMHGQNKEIKLIIAPHEIKTAKIDSIEKILGSYLRNEEIVKYSELNENNVSEARCIIVDNIGMLSSLYYYASIAYVGGAFGKGLHNILEAAAAGIPVIFGPYHSKFPEAQELINTRGGISVTGTEDLFSAVLSFYTNPDLRHQYSQASLDYIRQNTGATNKILSFIFPGFDHL